MKLASTLVGTEVGPIAHQIDARWLMAYAAGLGETDPRYYDTETDAGPAAHPIFPVCYEWPVALAIRGRTLPDGAGMRSVHASHDTWIHRSPRAGDHLVTTARVIAVEQRPAGARMTLRLETVDASGEPVSTTDYGSVYRGVSVQGPESDSLGSPAAAPRTATPPQVSLPPLGEITVSPQQAHVYTECARIWNPIHTDVAVARAEGLPDIILHGTATLALAVSRIVAERCGGDPRVVRRVTCRFTGMVPMPSRLTLRASAVTSEATVTWFDVLDQAGRAVVRQGALYR
jgi:acyl dehydratase